MDMLLVPAKPDVQNVVLTSLNTFGVLVRPRFEGLCDLVLQVICDCQVGFALFNGFVLETAESLVTTKRDDERNSKLARGRVALP